VVSDSTHDVRTPDDAKSVRVRPGRSRALTIGLASYPAAARQSDSERR
jgi:hypothetical protein